MANLAGFGMPANRTLASEARHPAMLESRIELAYRFFMAGKVGRIRHPFLVLAKLLAGLSTRAHFANGFTIRLDPQDLPIFRALVELSYPDGVDFRDGSATADDSDSWNVDKSRGIVTLPNGIGLTLASLRESGIIAETFVHDLHYWGTDLTGRTVIDVGASFGDTALYFASRGAQVYAFEPEPSAFRELLQNLVLNPSLATRIHAEECAVGPDGVLPFSVGQGSTSSLYFSGREGGMVRCMSLGTLLARFKIHRPFLLKVDAKGAEFELILQEALCNFEALSIEYTCGLRPDHMRGKLVKALEAQGFRVTRQFKHNSSYFSLNSHGMIHAVNKESPDSPGGW